MRDLNRVLLMGRLGNDPVLRQTQTGRKVAHFVLATGSKKKPKPKTPETEDETPPPESQTEWHSIVAWGKLAENVSSYLKKGSPVFIQGKILNRSYEAKDGTIRKTYEIQADDLNFLPRANRASVELEASALIAH